MFEVSVRRCGKRDSCLFFDEKIINCTDFKKKISLVIQKLAINAKSKASLLNNPIIINFDY